MRLLQSLSYIEHDHTIRKANNGPTELQKEVGAEAHKNPKKAYNNLVKGLREAKPFGKHGYAYVKKKNAGHGGGHRLHIVHVPTLHRALHKLHAAYVEGGEHGLKKALHAHAVSKSDHGHVGHIRLAGNHVGMAVLHKDHTRKGVMHDLYHHLVVKEGKKLTSGSQTKGARALWTKLSHHPDLRVDAKHVPGRGQKASTIKLRPGLTHPEGHSVYDKKHPGNKHVTHMVLTKR